MSYGYLLDVTLPPVTDRGPLFAQALNDVAKAIVRRVEAKVTEAGIVMDGPLSFASQAAEDIKAFQFKNQAAALDPGVYPRALFFSGQEYYVNSGSAQVRVTKDGAIDFSSAGAITGSGYGKNGTEIKWAGSGMYELWARTGVYADLECDDLRLATGFSGTVQGPLLRAPTMAADVEWQLPAAQPSNTDRQGLYVDATGVMQWSASLKHADMSLFVAISNAYRDTGGGWSFDTTAAEEDTLLETDAGFVSADFPIPLQEGDRIKSITAYARKAGVTATSWTLRKLTSGTASSSTGVVVSSSSAGAVAPTTVLGTPITVSFSEAYLIRIQGGNTGDLHFGVKVVYDRP